MNQYLKDNKIYLIVLLGFSIRVLFVLLGAEYYFGKEKFYVGGDTYWWFSNIDNLIEHGAYTDNIDNEWGYFTRTPGYSFFIGIFYLLSGKDIDIAFKIIVFTQIVLDSISIFLIYKIGKKIFDNSIGILSALIFSIYPFVIVWSAVVYAETLSIFLFLLSICFFLNAISGKQYFVSGAIFSLSVLTRIQLIVFIPFFIFISFLSNNKGSFIITNYKNTFLFILSIVIVYGSWPIRNIIIHGKPIFAQHLGDRAHWSSDYFYYMEYIWSVKTDHEPQLTQILRGEKVEFPPSSYIHKEDTLLLSRVIDLSRNCGEGFSYFARSMGLRDTVIKRGQDCNEEIVSIYKTLIENQKKYNKLSYYLLVPIGNLKKAILKNNLYKPATSKIALFANIFFNYRTVLILIGMFSLLYIFITDKNLFFSNGILIIFFYVMAWYIFHSFVYRNMEIRYLLHADILLIFPAAFGITKIYSVFKTAFLSK
jgi:4-amino-4-deoxy-L-arabinose transferase-like glycosyltransferase